MRVVRIVITTLTALATIAFGALAIEDYRGVTPTLLALSLLVVAGIVSLVGPVSEVGSSAVATALSLVPLLTSRSITSPATVIGADIGLGLMLFALWGWCLVSCVLWLWLTVSGFRDARRKSG